MFIKSKLIILSLVILTLGTQELKGQTLSGRVTDALTGQALSGANVTIEGSDLGAATDMNGYFRVDLSSGSYSVKASYIGFESKTSNVTVRSQNVDVNFALTSSSVDVASVSVVGSRFKPRTQMTSSVPVDNLSVRDLKSSGHVSVESMMTYKLPSYNSQQQTISDATAHFDPADLRGLGPSRTLVLVNGKRKNASALVYINDTPGKGEVGVDMKSIPVAAIERVEVLRDGASAQYGSDAIAGVVNVILKDDVDYTTVNFHSGITTEGDGLNRGFDASTGIRVGSGGYLNLSASFLDQEETNRAGEPGGDGLFGIVFDDEAILNGTNEWLQNNPDMGMRVGMPNMTINDVSYNFGYNLNAQNKLYSFGSLTTRKSLSYALYRAPYWIPDEHNIFHNEGETYQGFQPTFESDVIDNSLTTGVTGDKSGWNYDLSASMGSNSAYYTVDNSQNTDMGAESPTNFKPGGYEFRHTVTNFDLSRSSGMFTLGLGSEFRFENFVALEGEEASYFGRGAQSFPGIQPQNAVDVNRQNFGFYLDLGADLTEDLYAGVAARSEEYSDFGSSFTWKAAARFKTMDDKLALRGSASTGFRAPSLHQIYMSNIQTLISGGTVSNQGTFNNQSAVVRSLGVPKLKEENANNYSFGLTFKALDGLSLSLDMYNVQVDDRIVYSSSISSGDTTSAVGAILNDYNVTSIKFFTNAVSTTTSGIDFVGTYSGLDLGPGVLNLSLGFNQNKTVLGDEINTPTPIASSGAELFDRKEQSRLVSARPSNKLILGLNYLVGALEIGLNNTQFGTVEWKHASDKSKDQTFSAKLVTDLNLNYKVDNNLSLNLAVNNLANVYPDEIVTGGDFVTDLGGRFKYPWEVNQFGFMGTNIQGTVSYNF